MSKKFSYLLFLFAAWLGMSCSPKKAKKSEYNLVPYPQELVKQDGLFELEQDTKIAFLGGKNTKFVAQSMADFVAKATGFKNEVVEAKNAKVADGQITFITDSSVKGAKGSYQVTVKPEGIVVRSASPVGLYYGFQTLRQLLPADIEKQQVVKNVEWTIPCAEIKDEPEYSYRGLHLDVGRHFFPVDFLKRYIDLLALHKMNIFHWHLTEDQGWRLEIKKYPKLTEVGAYRAQTISGHIRGGNAKYDGKRYGGFYTQKEAREIVKYAADRFVTVIPEIELPGHSLGALTAYPELGCTGGPYKVAERWGVFPDVYCAGNEKSFEFLEDVLTEVMDIFPSKYIHIGGDECPKKEWKACPKCKARMKAEGCKDAHELQSYFITRMEKFLNKKGRSIIGWDEILEGGLAPNATVMSWRGTAGGIKAAKMKHNVIMTPGSHCYLDHYQNNPKDEPLAIGGFNTLSHTYSYNPRSNELSDAEKKYVIGVQGNVWTEYMKTSDHVEYMAFPRACALAEVAWLPVEKKDYASFAKRLVNITKRMDIMGVNYFNKVLSPTSSSDQVEFLTKGELKLRNNSVGAKMYYTTDGSEPTEASQLYTKPIEVAKEGVIKIASIRPDKKKSKTLEVKAVRLKYLESSLKPGKKKGLICKISKGLNDSPKKIKEAKGKKVAVSAVEVPKQAPQFNFSLEMNGFYTAQEEGMYKFSLGSDDGSYLYIDGKELIDNGGFHGTRYKSRNVALRKGATYPIQVLFFQGNGGSNLKLQVTSPSGKITKIAPGDLSHN
ncbi:MAG: family 20 glycosylhydrolase [Cytophagales bacterium]|nr:family 20 glycosylhydrolase [Cytophagales bacterium]